jgi:threonine dehydratase
VAFGIEEVRAAADRIAPHVRRTPVLASPVLDAAVGARVLVKAEPLQVTGSFKARGALNKVLGLGRDAMGEGLIGYSAGNHAAAVAAAGRVVGRPAVVVVPSTAPRAKIENCRAWGAEVVLYDPATEDRDDVTAAIRGGRDLTLVPPFDDEAVMAGAGTVGLELAEQLATQDAVPDAVVVGCSGGGLAAGALTALRHSFPDVAAYVVEPRGLDKMARSLAAGEVCRNPVGRTTLMDGIGGPVAGARPLRVLAELGVTPLTVDDEDALRAVAATYRHLKIVAEPAGAAALAAVVTHPDLFAGRTVAVVCSGGNVDPAVFATALLR